MRRQEINLDMSFSYLPLKEIVEVITPYAICPNHKFLVMTNSALQATDTLVPFLEEMLVKQRISGDIISIKGLDGMTGTVNNQSTKGRLYHHA